jgi:predicted HicB family RNase H-like nuclease
MHFNAWLPEQLYIDIKKLAAEQKRSLTEIAIECLNDYLHKYVNT